MAAPRSSWSLSRRAAGLLLLGAALGACGSAVGPSDGGDDARDAARAPDAVRDAPDAPDAGDDDVVLRGSSLERFEGHRLYAFLESVVGGGLQSAVVTSGRVEIRWRGARCTDCFGYGIAVYIDTDDDGRCTTEPVHFVAEGNPSDTLAEFTASDGTIGARDCSSFE